MATQRPHLVTHDGVTETFWALLRIGVANGQLPELLETFHTHQILWQSSATPGFLRADVLVGKLDSEVLVISQWTSQEAYQAWCDAPERRTILAALHALGELTHETRVYQGDCSLSNAVPARNGKDRDE